MPSGQFIIIFLLPTRGSPESGSLAPLIRSYLTAPFIKIYIYFFLLETIFFSLSIFQHTHTKMKEKNDFSILIYNLTRPSSCFVTREGNKYNDIHLSLSPFFLPFLRFQSTCFIVQKGKKFPIPSNPFFYFYFTFFLLLLIKSLDIFFR